MASRSPKGTSDDSYVDVVSSPTGDSPHGPEARRPIQLSTASIQVRIPVPVSPYEAWIAAVVLRDEFHRNLASLQSTEEKDALAIKDEEAESAADQEAEAEEHDETSSREKELAATRRRQKRLEAQIILTGKFLGFLASKFNTSSSNPLTITGNYEANVLQCTWVFFQRQFLGDVVDIHKLASTLDVDVRASLLRSYYEALILVDTDIQTPKLLRLAKDGGAEIFALFGGQGTNEVSPAWTIPSVLFHPALFCCLQFLFCAFLGFSFPPCLFLPSSPIFLPSLHLSCLTVRFKVMVTALTAPEN